ncbi:hypothetical protein PFISCL1PPCAC_8740 [Pristionchus fissidentatus]|uniref:G protein-coupled receptor n=1 Tax=Pristionchus fissidentatus TaxID=1538716 RepID=A0AAV5VGQ5_9BILA|nr:hypothetical protein PFISCL1PPCAC_8740 [Pristionchus fissidentatus]
MRLTEALNEPEVRLLVSLLVIFNAIPVIAGTIVFVTTFVINFGFALIFQLTATVVCLTFVIPTVLVCSTIALGVFLLIRVASEYVDLFSERRAKARSTDDYATPTVTLPTLSPTIKHQSMKLD